MSFASSNHTHIRTHARSSWKLLGFKGFAALHSSFTDSWVRYATCRMNRCLCECIGSHECTHSLVLYPGNSHLKLYNKLLQCPVTSRKLGLETPSLLQLPISSQQGLRLSFVKGKKNSMGSIINPARDFVCIPASAPLPWPGILAWRGLVNDHILYNAPAHPERCHK